MKKVCSMLIAALLAAMMVLPAFAEIDVPDLTRKGKLTVTILDSVTKDGVPGGKVRIYEVAKAALDPYTGYFYDFTAEFEGFEEVITDLRDITAEEMLSAVEKLEKHIKDNQIPAVQMAVPNEDGSAIFEDVELGLYLVIQSEGAPKYAPVKSFLITVPNQSEDGWEYEVDAAPKVGTSDLLPTTKPTTTPTYPWGSGGKLPQTGQLWWPVYWMTGIGLGLFVLGYYRRKRASNEA